MVHRTGESGGRLSSVTPQRNRLQQEGRKSMRLITDILRGIPQRARRGCCEPEDGRTGGRRVDETGKGGTLTITFKVEAGKGRRFAKDNRLRHQGEAAGNGYAGRPFFFSDDERKPAPIPIRSNAKCFTEAGGRSAAGRE